MRNKLSVREDIVDRVIRVALESDDSIVINFTLERCFNKTRIFENFETNSYLHIATERNYVNCLKIFIEHGFNIDIRNSNGETCLYLASKRGYLRILFLLLEAKANPFICNKDGKNVLDVAYNKTIKESLRQYTAKCTEIKLIKNLRTWKEIFAEEKLNALNTKEISDERSHSLQDLSRSTLKRSDSGIVADHVEVTKQPQATKHSLSFDDAKKQSTKQASNLEKSKFVLIGSAILGASLSPLSPLSPTLPYGSNETKSESSKAQKLAKSVSMRDFSRNSALIRSISDRAFREEDENSSSTHTALKVSAKYQDPKRNLPQIVKRHKKFNRNERMSMPEVKILSTGESYI